VYFLIAVYNYSFAPRFGKRLSISAVFGGKTCLAECSFKKELIGSLSSKVLNHPESETKNFEVCPRS